MKRLIAVLGVLAASACLFYLLQPPRAEVAYDKSSLTIQTAAGPRQFAIELAQSPAQQEHGLMFRRDLPEDQGMLFLFSPPQEVSFWMKNTLIPLDMLFIGADGRIARIAANAAPQSLDTIPSGGKVAAVLEISGGGAAKLGIKTGDAVASPDISLPTTR